MQPTNKTLTLLVVMSLVACSPADTNYRVVGALASDRIELTADVAEPITDIAVAEGAAVVAGDVLVQQNADRAIARLKEATASLAEAQARLDELVRGPRSEQIGAARANVDGATQDLSFREEQYARAQNLHAKQLASPQTLDLAKANLDAAVSTLDLRRNQLQELLAGTTVEELAQSEQGVRQAEARRDGAQVDVDRHTIRAPVDGIADSRLFEIGERPGIGQPVMVLLAGTQTYARVYVPENLRVQIKAGTAATIHVDGLESPIAGRVRWISAEAAFTPYFALTEHDRGRLSYVAKVDIAEDRERLPDGVPVVVEFLTGAVQ